MGRLKNASVPQTPSPTQPDTSPLEGEPAGIGALEYEDLEADAMDEALEASDLSVEEAVERFHRMPAGEAGGENRKKEQKERRS